MLLLYLYFSQFPIVLQNQATLYHELQMPTSFGLYLPQLPTSHVSSPLSLSHCAKTLFSVQKYTKLIPNSRPAGPQLILPGITDSFFAGTQCR